MTKQKEIREGIAGFVSKAYWYEGKKNIVVSVTGELIAYLHSSGCVLKVERWLPENKHNNLPDIIGYHDAQQDMLKAGYTAVELLLENRNDP